MSVCWVRHPMAKDVERRWSTIIACVVKLRNLSFVVAMSALNMKARIPCLFRTYKAPESSPPTVQYGRLPGLPPLLRCSPNCYQWRAIRRRWYGPTPFNRCSKMHNSSSLINISPASLALERDKLRQSVSQIPTGFNQSYPSMLLTLCKRLRPIARKVHKMPHDVLKSPQESISVSTFTRGCRTIETVGKGMECEQRNTHNYGS